VILAAGIESTRSELLASIAKLLPEGFVLKIPPGWDEETLCMSAKDADAILGSSRPCPEICPPNNSAGNLILHHITAN
jgi:hypothetical protein